MNRRKFIQSLAAVFSLPAMPSLSLSSATAAVPTAVAVPTQARFWAIYMSALHGDCPPHALQTVLNIPAVDAKKYVAQLIADGAIKPNPLLRRSVSEVLKTNDDSFLNKVKNRLEMKTKAQSNAAEGYETIETNEPIQAHDTLDYDAELETNEELNLAEDRLENGVFDESLEIRDQLKDTSDP